MPKLLLFLFSVLLFIGGCKTTLQSNWKNFNAYYNTYYNAEESYNAGVKKNLGQGREYNPLQPIRIHEKPINAGAQDFDKAIQKGADVLRKYDETKWVDNALELIGKSYYYRQEYFSADQKFKELYATSQDRELQQKAILWQGRVLLEMERYNEGVSFLTEQLSSLEGEWLRKIKAEVRALLAEHYVQLQSWELARQELTAALSNLSQKHYRERGYFLLGQIFERLDNPEAAYEAYDQVQNHHTEYRLQYLAQRKKAEVARNLGRHDIAGAIFNDMVRDDKNIEYRAELDFELARTEQRRENFKEAERVYKKLLRNQRSRPSPEIATQTYYGLAEIYRYYYDDFTMAATYYDSAAQPNVPADKLPEDFEAKALAESFGSYARLKKEITLQDSLLKLGRLSPEEFELAMENLRAQKLAELEQLRQEQEAMQNTVVNVDQEAGEEDATSLRNGFLNSDNPQLQQTARLQFYAVWGDRPLADNWRVRSMIRSSRSANETEDDAPGNNAMADVNGEKVLIEIDISAVPFTKADQDSVQRLISSQQYQLGNLFFLSLNMPDSAAFYFKQAVENPSERNVKIVSLYSLAELFLVEGDTAEARTYANELMTKYPNTDYARRLADKFGMELNSIDDTASVNPRQVYEYIVSDDSLSLSQKAEKLKNFARKHASHELAPAAQFQAAELYMSLAKKQHASYQNKINDWMNAKSRWESRQEEFQTEKKNARVALSDSTISDENKDTLEALSDSTLQAPDFSQLFPYEGMYWDSTRSAVEVLISTFRESKFAKRASRLHEELKAPEEKAEEEIEAPAEELSKVKEGYLSCEDLQLSLEVRGGMERFLDTINLPEQNELAEIEYEFLVNQRGIIDESHLQTENVDDELIAAFESAIESSLSFEPVLSNGQAVAVQCVVKFPLRN